MDTEEAVDRISRQLLQHDIMTEGYGGEVPIVPVSKIDVPYLEDCKCIMASFLHTNTLLIVELKCDLA